MVEAERVTAAEVTDRARAQVGGLFARGVVPGDWVAFFEPGGVDLLAAVHGCLLAGVAPVVLSPQLTAHERRELLADLPVRVVGDLVPGEPVELGSFHRSRPVHVTSGTTGAPKAVWSGWLDEAAAGALHGEERDIWDLRPDDVHLVLAPLSHSAPLRFALNTVLAGGDVVVLPKFDADNAAAAVATHRPTTTFAAPAHLQRLLALDPVPDLGSFRLVAHAGSPCPERVKRAAIAAFPEGAVTEFYGSTEAQFTVCPPDVWLAHPQTVGRARPGRELQVRDGRVWVRLPAHARFSYFDAPEKTAAAWDGDWFTAGDLGALDDGLLTLHGRDGDLVLSGGVNVYPAEVERALRELPGVDDAVVFGRPDEHWGERVCAVVAGEVDAGAVCAWAAERLAAPKRPKQVTVVAVLPRTLSGKPDRRAAQALL